MQRNSRHHLNIEKTLATGENLTKKITIKTRPASWINSEYPVILPFSIDSYIYESDEGRLKISALLELVKNNVKDKITVLLCDKAHFHTLMLKCKNDRKVALETSLQKANALKNRFKQSLSGCDLFYWEDFINKDNRREEFESLVHGFYHSHEGFKKLIRADVEKTCNEARAKEFPDKSLYILNAELDILEQCIYLLIVANKGYKFEFYPGKRILSADFINTLLDNSKKLIRINVTLGTVK